MYEACRLLQGRSRRLRRAADGHLRSGSAQGPGHQRPRRRGQGGRDPPDRGHTRLVGPGRTVRSRAA